MDNEPQQPPQSHGCPPTPSPGPSAAAHSPGFLIWRLWQHVAIALSYPLFVVGSSLLLALVPVSLLISRDRSQRINWMRRAFHNGAGLWVRMTESLGLISVEIDDKRLASQTAQRCGSPPLMVIANHPSLIDVLLINAALPDLCCVLKGDLHANPLFTLLIRHLDYLPNSDPERMLQEGSARLLQGERLLIFPEGTRTTRSQMQSATSLQFRLGAAELARRSGADALPVVIHYADEYLGKGHPWYKLPRDVLRFRLEIGPILAGAKHPTHADDGERRQARKQTRRHLNKRWIDHFVERLSRPGVGN